MQVTLTKQATPHKLKFIADATVVKELMDQEYDKVKSNIEIPGFRKGHAPRAEAEKRLDRFKLYQNIFTILYQKAIEEKQLPVVDAYDFEVLGQFDDKVPLAIQATVFLKPKVLSFDIDKVNFTKKVTEITDQMVSQQVSAIQSKDTTYTVVDDSYNLKTDDVITMDYEGRIDGKLFQGGASKNFRYVIGQTKFIPGFEEQLLQMKIGVSGIIKVQFPQEYHNKDLNGKFADFTTTIHKKEATIKKSIEELATANSQSIDEYKATIKNKLIKDYEKIDQDNFESGIIAACISSSEIEPLPEVMIGRELDGEWNQFLYRMSTSEEEYLKKFKDAKSTFYAQTKRRVEKTLESKIFLDHICDIRNITASKEDVDAFIQDRTTKLQKSEEEKKSIIANLKKEVNYKASETAAKHEKAISYLTEYVQSKQK